MAHEHQKAAEAREAEKARRAEEALLLPQVPYLRDDPQTQALEPEVVRLPFQPATVNPIRGTEFLLEQVEGVWYLRSTAVSQFCRLAKWDSRWFTEEDFVGTGVSLVTGFTAYLLTVKHRREKECVGYFPRRPTELHPFIPAFVSQKRLKDLPPTQAVLYLSTAHAAGQGEGGNFEWRLLSKYQSGLVQPRVAFDAEVFAELQQRKQRLAAGGSRHPPARGAWAAEMFENAFGGDTSQMTDAEYEMIFGEPR
jgi:hypothetical protein